MLLEEQTLAYTTSPTQTAWLQNIDKSTWRKVKLGEVVSLCKNTLDKKKIEKFDKFVGFEHIASENVKIVDYGLVQEGVSFTNIAKKGQVLFGKIRPYLKKAGIIDFDALCSSDLLVMEAVKTKFCQKLLPFILLDQKFIDHAIQTSIGTKMPRTKWQALQEFEFLLPPLDFQERFASLLWDIEAQIEHTYTLEKDLQATKKAVLQEVLGRQGGRQVKFGEVAHCISQQVKPQDTDIVVYIGLEHLEPESLQITRFGKPSDVEGVKLKATKGDIIFGKRRAYQRKVAICEVDAIVSAHSMVLRANTKEIYPDFLPYFMQSDEFMERAVSISEGSLSPTIKWKVLAEQTFFIPASSDRQAEYTALFRSFDARMQEVRQARACLQALKRGLIQEVIG